MCDIILALPNSTADDALLFGKSSDRQRNEAQAVEYYPLTHHEADTELRCTYLGIPQVRHTHAILICRPFWIWGAEMGVNQHGVVIGNEGLHARAPTPEQPALIGMDLVRLALERSDSAAEAVQVITALLAQYGQGGNCGHLAPSYYQNSFMIADHTEAFVLETVGREWLLERVRDVRAISNDYSVSTDLLRTSSGLDQLIRDSGWPVATDGDYGNAIANREKEHIGQSGMRRARATSAMRSCQGKIRAPDMMRILRDHGGHGEGDTVWNPRTVQRYGLCIHAGPEERGAQTTGAMVSELRQHDATHWVTATAATCLSIFKPLLMDVPIPPHGPRLSDRFDPDALWWRHERLHRTALTDDLSRFLADIQPERDALEAKFYSQISAVTDGGSLDERARIVAQSWSEAIETEDRWTAQLQGARIREGTPYDAAWSRLNRIAGIEGL